MAGNYLARLQVGEVECRAGDGQVDVASCVLHEWPLPKDAADCLHHLSLAVSSLESGSLTDLADALSEGGMEH